VATIARSRCRYVAGGLPSGLNPVVTREAGARSNPPMGECRASPAHCAMTAITGHCRRHMSRGLAWRNRLVMAFGAGSWNYPVVCEKSGRPTCRPVTAVTVEAGRQVIRRLKGGDHSPAW
jgi:hypothetical protein